MKTSTIFWMLAALLAAFGAGCDLGGSSSEADLACKADADCEEGYCNLDTGECVDCLSDGHCPTNRYCLTAKNVCVACFENQHCKAGVCDKEKNYCVECLADADCPSATCDEENGICIECGSDKECDDKNPCTVEACSAGECLVVPMPDDTPCEDDDPCTVDDTCQDGACQPGVSLGQNCQPDPQCEGKDPGTLCEDGDPCTVDDFCQKGVCMPGEVDPACFGQDEDKDGWTLENGDCNDKDPTVHPEAEELCDKIDNDCDSVIDEDCPPPCLKEGEKYTQDPSVEQKCCDPLVPVPDCQELPVDCDSEGVDCWPGYECSCPECLCFVCTKCGDGECGPGENKCNCEQDCFVPPVDEDLDGYTVEEDCNDFDPMINPGMKELCNGFDDNCDAQIDEGCQVCMVSGCSGEICAPQPLDSDCQWLPEYDCLEFSECGPYGPDGKCDWLATPEYKKCLESICKPVPETCDGMDNDCNGLVDEGCFPPCGGFAGFVCPEGMFCLFDPGTCMWPDMMGTCAYPPEACFALFKPVCGCDGKTYGNECEANAAGVSVQSYGECGSGSECTEMCDCYKLYGEQFEKPCLIDCFPCGNYWQCIEGKCIEACGFLPPGVEECIDEPCLDMEKCGNGLDDDCNGLIDDGCGDKCGGIAGFPCPEGMFCLFDPGTCLWADMMGVCQQFPIGCPKIYKPVCGCDGTTYDNECLMLMEGMSMDYEGECEGSEECSGVCDCYEKFGGSFENPCPLMCANCGNYWQCVDGQCIEQCGFIPPEVQKCQVVCLPSEICGNGEDDDCNGLIDDGCGTECVKEGGSYFGSTANDNQCCPGLKPVWDCKEQPSPCTPEDPDCPPFQCSCPKCLCFVCTACGDGMCGPGENKCSCPEDCMLPGECLEDVNCDDGSVCTKDACINGKCAHEIVPDCGVFCTGDNECAPGTYCRFNDGTCKEIGQPGATGACVPIPQVCPEVWIPVCGCDGQTYGNDCEMQMALQTKDYDGECQTMCIDEGQKFMGSPDAAQCCEGLKPIADCSVDVVCPADGGLCTAKCNCLKCMCFVCAACGNGFCGPGENFCNCQEDCKPPECMGDANCNDNNSCTIDACLNGLCVHDKPKEICGNGKDDDCDGQIDDADECLPVPACKKLDPKAYGVCGKVLGYGFDGAKCVLISGCSCLQDCASIFLTLDECKKACAL